VGETRGLPKNVEVAIARAGFPGSSTSKDMLE
jgi:hypothetical protein